MTKNKSGRKSKYETLEIVKCLDSIEGWARHGSTMAEIASMIGVAESTLYEWKRTKPEFSKALRAGSMIANGEILRSAFDQAVGSYKLVKDVRKVKKQRWDKDAGRVLTDEVIEPVEYMQYFPPVPSITQFMLTNRLRDQYQTKVVTESKGALQIGMTDADKQLLDKVQKRLDGS